MIVTVPRSVARARPEPSFPESASGMEVFVRAGALRRPTVARALRRAVPMAMAIAAGVASALRMVRFLLEPRPLVRRRKRLSLSQALQPSSVQVGDRVRYSVEYLRTATGPALELRRGKVVAERMVPNYPGDPSPRQVVTVLWDDDPEPGKALGHFLEPVGRGAPSRAS